MVLIIHKIRHSPRSSSIHKSKTKITFSFLNYRQRGDRKDKQIEETVRQKRQTERQKRQTNRQLRDILN